MYIFLIILQFRQIKEKLQTVIKIVCIGAEIELGIFVIQSFHEIGFENFSADRNIDILGGTRTVITVIYNMIVSDSHMGNIFKNRTDTRNGK